MERKLGVIAVAGILAVGLGLLLGGGSCAPTGNYSGDGTISYDWERGGFEYGNGCIWYVREIPVVLGALLIGAVVARWVRNTK